MIRPATTRDRSTIRDILVATGRFTPQQIGWAMELVDLALRQPDRSEYLAYVFEDDQKTIHGYALYGPTPMTEGVYDLYWIAVDPQWQRHGDGQLLLYFVENEVRQRGGRMLLIETSSKRSYAPTIRFYERAGYHEISRIKDFYRIEDDKLVFCKHLT
ncbi:MAG: GNAT family N-acetyltransferase [Acidobacteriota bacterium]|nr:GNAT family N-acetyltransferase [Acidobacteriota bacterium]